MNLEVIRFWQLASCLSNAWPLRANKMGSDQSVVSSWHYHLNTFFYCTRSIWQQWGIW